jgi:RNA polymerase sigma factor for flagellar operon FliA
MDVNRLWQRYERRKTTKVRDQLIENYLGLVQTVANSVASNLPKSVDRDDLVSVGYIGLMDAIEKFEPSRGLKFETYAVSRIRGQMLDELRSTDWVPRSVRSRSKQIETTAANLTDHYGRPVTDIEIAEELKLPVERVQKDRDKAAVGRMVPLDHRVESDSGDSMTLIDVLSDEKDDMSYLDDLFGTTVDAIRSKSGRETVVITLYYYEGLTLAEIGRVLGVTESRVCQIHTTSITNLDINV